MKIYTKTGDRGTTSLVGGERAAKNDVRVNAYGTVDELTAFLALLRDSMDPDDAALDIFRSDLRTILNTLMTVEAQLASCGTESGKAPGLAHAHVRFLEERCDTLSAELPPVEKFTLPGGHPLVSLAHVCRTVCRRAERETVGVAECFRVHDDTMAYLNRLSDYLYLAGRSLAVATEAEEVFWEPDK